MYYINIIDDHKYKIWGGSKILDIGNLDTNAYNLMIGFFTHLKFQEYGKFFNDTLKKGGYYHGEMHFFYGPFAEEDISLTENEVLIKTMIDIGKIPIVEFEATALYLAQKALEAATKFNLKDLGHIDQQWIDDIKNWIRIKE